MINTHTKNYISKLFENGIETYDRNTKENSNIGGAKPWLVRNWKSPNSSIVINNEELRKILFTLPASLYTFSRVELDADRKPVELAEGNGFRRILPSFMLYMQLNEADNIGRRVVDTIVSNIPELGGYAICLEDYEDELRKMNMVVTHEGRSCLSGVLNRDFLGNDAPVALSACIFFPLPSGAVGSAQYWSYIKTSAAADMIPY